MIFRLLKKYMYNQYFLKLLNKFNISYLFYLVYKISLKNISKKIE